MRKAKVVAIVCGLIASCLIGGFAVVEAATITLDDSSTIETVVYETTAEEITECAATVTFIETTAVTTTSMTVTTDSKTPVMTVEPQITTMLAEETAAADDSTTTAIDAIAVIKDTAALPVRATEPATEETPAATTATTKATTVATTKAATTTKATTTAPETTTTVATTAAPTEEVVLTNPPMPEQPAEENVPEFEIPAIEEEVPVEVVQTEAPTEAAKVEPVVEQAPAVSSSVSVSDSDYVLLCNAVAHEAGSNSISETDKAKVVEVIMNRVASPNYPNTIYGVLTQRNQFSGSSSYVNLTSFSGKVTSKVKAGVDLYFADPSAFNQGYLNFYGDGKQNHFS